MEFTPRLERDLKRWIEEGLVFEASGDRLSVSIQMVPIGFSREIVVGHLVSSFALNGLVAVPFVHLDQIWRRPTDQMQSEEMRLMGRLRSWPAVPAFAVKPTTIADLLRSIPDEEPVAIDHSFDCDASFSDLGWVTSVEERVVEDDTEYEADGNIEPTETVIRLRTFTGSGRIDDELSEIDVDNVTAVELRSRYLEGYAHFFARGGEPYSK